ncbi:hypothetical protein ASG12_03255 [Williamsia sp. Leaf354]|uniref:hypothetical protein n=1 Tax=Williamsia sp. Leaf354 TaxID=1736349 RepID=UPI0006FCA091|nr:hypothetical protein [Williamsia sp. Leaf354]KQR99803.1 hypothetical protein ASG12_03255 [Williamsia sp. Leaf354]
MIVASYDRIADLAFEAVIFLDTESSDCFQIQRDLLTQVTTTAPTYQVSTGMSAPVPDGITQWRRIGDRFEFALTARASRIFGGTDVLSFDAEAADGVTLDEIAEHVERLLR